MSGAKWCFINTSGNMEPCECFDDNMTYDNEYCNPANYGDNNTMCIYEKGVMGAACGDNVLGKGVMAQVNKDAIVNKHNELRARIAKGEETQGVGGGQPKAANMLKMIWSDELAAVAQRWADQCVSGHDENRRTATYGAVGQNYGMRGSSVEGDTTDWGSFIQKWYDEVKDWPAANVESFDNAGATGTTGHYTQVVWAESREVGCGYVYFKEGSWYRKHLLCNYGPAGNFWNKAVYLVGDPGSECPPGSFKSSDGLCA